MLNDTTVSSTTLSKGLKSEHHITNLLNVLISLDNLGKPIDTKKQIITFLDHQYLEEDDKWVKGVHDADGKYISSFNSYLVLLKVFFRWLFNSRNRPEDQDEAWKTPHFLRIKPLRDSPYVLMISGN